MMVMLKFLPYLDFPKQQQHQQETSTTIVEEETMERPTRRKMQDNYNKWRKTPPRLLQIVEIAPRESV
jgi:hypothetical protein